MIEDQPKHPSRIGPSLLPDGRCEFVVWAPSRRKIEVQLRRGRTVRAVPMDRDALGYFHVIADDVAHGDTYFYRLDDSHERPDPSSRFQPEGVHGPSAVVDPSKFSWTDANWKGLALEDQVFYELHVGTYTPPGTFRAIIERLDGLRDLGITTIELMPIAQFPGSRNWGYDGVYPYAPQNTYGTPEDLQELVDAAHARELAVALDVVYNHLGPEGNYLGEYAPYFTDHYRTPWGAALNYDRAHSDEVRHYFVQNALYWLREFHIDALRLDAVHSIFDASAFPFLAELSEEVRGLSARLGRRMQLIAESDLNDVRVLQPVVDGGLGMDAQWSDDFHHSVHTLLTGEKAGYYGDFGEVRHLAKTLKQGWYYSGQYSRHRERRHGNPPDGSALASFVVCTQNHDQVGNRALGERLTSLVDFESLKLAAGVTLLSSFVPMLFMGEEYGETAPFQYFTSHGDPQLAEAVRKGRESEFASFGWQVQVPDPQAESTFAASRLNHALIDSEPHRTMFRFYRRLLQLRRELSLARAEQVLVSEFNDHKAVLVVQRTPAFTFATVFHFGDLAVTMKLSLGAGTWTQVIRSNDPEWRPPGQDAAGHPSAATIRVDDSGSADIFVQARSFVMLERANSAGAK
jgi:maltooligosyltrehalose trehalohydrolase